MASPDRQRLRTTFDEAPELYDRARPSYPPQLFDDLIALAQLPTAARLLEIGCGTGIATVPLAERGFRLVCVELGEGLAAVARRKLGSFPAVEVVTAAFETWEPAEANFDAIVSFTAFHWIEPDIRYEKSARLLRPGGALAVVATQHVLPEDGDPFFVEVEEVYRALLPGEPGDPPPRPEEVGGIGSEMTTSGRFGEAAERRYLWDVTYSADEHVAVLNTYSGHRALDAATRRRLLAEIHRRIEARPGRAVRKTYLATLTVAPRL